MQNNHGGSTENTRNGKRELDTEIETRESDGNDAIVVSKHAEQNAKCNDYFASNIQTQTESVEPRAAQPEVKDLVPYPSRLNPNWDKKFKPNCSSLHADNSGYTQNLPVDNLNNVKPIPAIMPNGVSKRSTQPGDDDDETPNNSTIAGPNNIVALKPNLELVSVSDDYGDFKKLDMMTAADFDRDRYARFGIHETEAKDYIRTMAYKNCIEACAEKYIKGKVVLVVRSGIGLLPMLCIRSGLAKTVIALEESACIEYARRIIKDNNYIHKITLIQSSVHDLKSLPHGLSQVDVILSDFMGECVLNQGVEMEQVILARDRFLKPNGLMIPMRVTLYGQLLEQRKAFDNQRVCESKNMKVVGSERKRVVDDLDDTNLSWWGDVYGFDMRSKQSFLIDSSENDGSDMETYGFLILEPIVTYFNPKKVVSNACAIKEFNMNKCTIADVRHVHCKDLTFKCFTRSNTGGGEYGHMIELFMRVDFPCKQMNNNGFVGFSTSSVSPGTRYRQTGLLLRDQLLINNGDKFIINDFHMWRGPQTQENTLFETSVNGDLQKFDYSENLKLRLQYTFVNKCMRALNRRCAYILERGLF